MDKIDPGPGYRLLEVGEEKPMGYEVHQPFGEEWAEGTQPGTIVQEHQRAMRIKLPELASGTTTPSIPEPSGTTFSGTVEPIPLEPDTAQSCPVSCFLQWVADRLVHVHGDPENVDFVLRLRDLAASYPSAPHPFTRNKYTRDLKALDGRVVPVDVYGVLAAFPTGSAAVDHAIKKLLAPGQRGHKDRIQDLKEARASLDRAIQMEEG